MKNFSRRRLLAALALLPVATVAPQVLLVVKATIKKLQNNSISGAHCSRGQTPYITPVDESDLAALITATHVRTSNAAVDEWLRSAKQLSTIETTAGEYVVPTAAVTDQVRLS